IWRICQASEQALPETAPAPERPERAARPTLAQRLQALRGAIGRTVRAEQWWDHKLVPVFSVFYATACMQRASVASIWSSAVALPSRRGRPCAAAPARRGAGGSGCTGARGRGCRAGGAAGRAGARTAGGRPRGARAARARAAARLVDLG